MEHLEVVFSIILSGLTNEIANEIKVQDNKIYIKLLDNSVACITLEKLKLHD